VSIYTSQSPKTL